MANYGNIFKALVVDSDPSTGNIEVVIPSVVSADRRIAVTTVGRTAIDGIWKVPAVGEVVFLASEDDNLLTLSLIPTYTYDSQVRVDDIYGDLHGMIVVVARNDTASTIAKNTPVCGQADGADLVLAPANANDLSKVAIGIAIESIAPDAYGKVAVAGVLEGINTSTFAANIDVFLGPTGTLVSTPVGLTFAQIMGRVLKVGTNGSILIGIENPNSETYGSFSGVFAGTLYATAGNIGGASAGWVIDSNRLESRGTTKKIVMDGTDGQIYIGTYGTGVYNGASTPFYVDRNGYFSLGNKLTFNPVTNVLDVNGTITADAGNIAGWSILPNRLSSGTGSSSVSLASSGGTSIYAGSSNPAVAPFKVTNTGILTATGVDLSGRLVATSGSIGGWNITAASISSSGATPIILDSNGKITIGNTNWGNSANYFYVANDGKFGLGNKLTWDTSTLLIDGVITSASGVIGGWNIGTNRLYAGASSTYVELSTDEMVEYRTWAGHPTAASAPFRVKRDGTLIASGASINGAINATSGTFTGTISAAAISGSTITGGSISGTSVSGVSITGSTVTAGSISGNTITGGSISGALITAGSINGNRITGGSISGAVVTAGSISGSSISGNTITGGTISGASVTAGSISGNFISGGSISGALVTAGSISGNTITGSSISGTTITAGSISGNTISGGSITGASLTAASISGGQISIGSGFSVNPAGVLTATGACITGGINSTSGSIGGFLIGPTSLTAGTGSSAVGLQSTGTYPVWAGNPDSFVAPFSVRYDGFVTASSVSVLNFYNTAGSIPSILQGQFQVDAGKVAIGRQIGTGASSSGLYINKTVGTTNDPLWDNYWYSSGRFRVGSPTGYMTFDGSGSLVVSGSITGSSVSGTSITGSSISGTTITAGSISGNTITGGSISGASITAASISGGQIAIGSNFNVTNSGVLTASGASINGAINASSGTFTGTITAASITGGSISGALITAGSISGTSVTGASLSGGQITIGSNFNVTNAGVLTASGASINGAINASSGTFTGTITAASITGGSINGALITAGSINAARITGGSISGALVTAGSISGNTITGGSISGTLITAGSISGNTITGGTITGSSVSGAYVTGGSVTGIYVNGGSVDIGTNPSVSFHIDTAGNVWTGASSNALSTAPFRLYNDGSIDIGGNDATSLHINAIGNVYAGTPKADPSVGSSAASISGTITGLSGSILTINTVAAHNLSVDQEITATLIGSSPTNVLNFTDYSVLSTPTSTSLTVANPVFKSISAASATSGSVTYTTSTNHNFRTGASVTIAGVGGGTPGFNGIRTIGAINAANTFVVVDGSTGTPVPSSATAVMTTTHTGGGQVRRIPPFHVQGSDGAVRASLVVSSDRVSGSSNHLNLSNVLNVASNITIGDRTLFATDSYSSYDEGFNFSLSAANGFNARVGTTSAIQINASGYTSILPISTSSNSVTFSGLPTITVTSGHQAVYRNNLNNSLAVLTSQRALKENIVDISDSGSLIDLLRPVNFVAKATGEETPEQAADRVADIQFGFIAEEVADASGGKLASYAIHDGERIPVVWRMPDMIALAIAELKDLRQRVSALETQ